MQWLLNTLLKERADLALLQETKLGPGHAERAAKFFERLFEFCYSNAVGHSAGTAILVRKNRGITVFPEWKTDHSGRVCAVDLLCQSVLLRVVSVHAPNEPAERKTFFEDLKQYIDTPARVIVGGDFNCVLNAKDCTRGVRQDSSLPVLRKLLREHDLQDVTVMVNLTGNGYTHWQGECHSRLDRFYASGEMIRAVRAYRVEPVAFSDHALVTVRFGKTESRKQDDWWQSWKLNETLLEDDEVVKMVETLIAQKTVEGINAVNWELLKQEIKVNLMRAGRERANNKRMEKALLNRTLKTLIRAENETPGLFGSDIKECKGRLLSVLKEEFKGAMVRCRMTTLERDEEPTKVFKVKERERAQKNKITELRTGEAVLTQQEDVEREFVRFYRELFEEKNNRNEGLLRQFVELMPKAKTSSGPENEDITADEVLQAIKDLAPRKSPGIDGLGAAFYKKFSEKLAPILSQVYADIFKRGLLPPSLRQSVTVLIPKKINKEETRSTDDYRPISLLTADYKILAKILNKRLERMLNPIIGEHQTYGFKGRTISSNLHVMRMITETANALQTPIAVLQVDLKKAFDKVAHSFLFSMLKHCGVGEKLLGYVKLCYKDITTRLLINGCKSRPIPVLSSVRQGCPMSPILFALYLEPLCKAILSDVSIRGANLADSSVKLLAYADDVSIVCSSRRELVSALAHINNFCSVSGAEMNVKKSSGTWMGPWPSKPKIFIGIQWSDSMSNYLGLSLNLADICKGESGLRLNAVRAKAADWQGRNIPLLSRSFVCNSVFFSCAWYSAQVLPCHSNLVQKMQRMCATFVWNSSFEKTRRTNLFISPHKGGLGLISIDTKLKVHRFMLFRDKKVPMSAAAFLKLGGCYLSSWLDISNSDAAAKKAPVLRYYKEIAEAVKFFESRFSKDYLSKVKRKRLYWDTIDLVMPLPLYRSGFSEADGSDVFRRLRRYPVRQGIKDLFIRFHMEVLPVKTWEENKGFLMPWGTNCAICPVPETLQHTFLYCTNAEIFWARLRAEVGIALYPTWHSLKFLDVGNQEHKLCWEMLALIGIHAIWSSRTDHTLVREGGQPAWRYLIQGINYVSSLTKATEFPESDFWDSLKLRLK